MWDEIKAIESGRKQLREFGLTLGVVLGIVAAVQAWHNKETWIYFAVSSALFMGLSFIAPFILKPLQKIWMGLAIVLGWFVSRIILGILFYGVVTPTGIIVRLSGRDLLNRKLDPKAPTYWIPKPKRELSAGDYEKQF